MKRIKKVLLTRFLRHLKRRLDQQELPEESRIAIEAIVAALAVLARHTKTEVDDLIVRIFGQAARDELEEAQHV